MVLTGVGAGFAVGFALADLVGVGVAEALVGAFVDDVVALDELARTLPRLPQSRRRLLQLENGARGRVGHHGRGGRGRAARAAWRARGRPRWRCLGDDGQALCRPQ